MKKRQHTMRNEKGSLTVEALLFLIPFMCAFFTMINVARFVQSEMLIHHAITQTAKQISTYSYVLTKTDIAGKIQATNKKSNKFKKDTSETIDSVSQFFNAMGSVGAGDPVGELTDIYNSGKDAGQKVYEYFSKPEDILNGVFAAVKSDVRSKALTSVAGGICKINIKNALLNVTDDPDEYLENIGIVDGMEGLNFSKSSWLDNDDGKGNLDLVVTYKLKNLLFPQFDFGEHTFCQCASTLIW